eukprot:352200-Chlamydomonas_euryale.AAC.1
MPSPRGTVQQYTATPLPGCGDATIRDVAAAECRRYSRSTRRGAPPSATQATRRGTPRCALCSAQRTPRRAPPLPPGAARRCRARRPARRAAAAARTRRGGRRRQRTAECRCRASRPARGAPRQPPRGPAALRTRPRARSPQPAGGLPPPTHLNPDRRHARHFSPNGGSSRFVAWNGCHQPAKYSSHDTFINFVTDQQPSAQTPTQ